MTSISRYERGSIVFDPRCPFCHQARNNFFFKHTKKYFRHSTTSSSCTSRYRLFRSLSADSKISRPPPGIVCSPAGISKFSLVMTPGDALPPPPPPQAVISSASNAIPVRRAKESAAPLQESIPIRVMQTPSNECSYVETSTHLYEYIYKK